MNVGAGRLRLLVLGCLLVVLSGCGDDEPEALRLPTTDDGTSTTVTTATTATETETADGTTSTTEGADGSFAAMTVQFDPDDPPALEQVEELLFAAVEADYGNAMWCWANMDVCDVERDLGPAIAGDRILDLQSSLSTYREEGGAYQRGDGDAIYRVESAASLDGDFTFGENAELRTVGAVVACEVWDGVYYRPDATGGVGEVLNDTPAGYLTGFRVWQDTEGVLRVGARSFEEEGGPELCDAYRE